MTAVSHTSRTLMDVQIEYVNERRAAHFDGFGRYPKDDDAILQERDGYTMHTIATYAELYTTERPDLLETFTDYLGLCENCLCPMLGDDAICDACIHEPDYPPIGGGSQELDTEAETAAAVSDLPRCATTEEYMAYQMGFAAGQQEYQELPESSVRTMYAAMRQSLARPAVYPTGITGTDRAHMEGRCDAYGYYLRNRPTPPTLLSRIRELISAARLADAALDVHIAHYEAGYDTGYEQQYQQDMDRINADYYAKAAEVDRIELELWNALSQHDDFTRRLQFDRALRIARRYA